MHLKSLTMRGFKSFASTTTLQLEPGITCVVGPNGSGKSNVVDALSWVMGEQGAKSLRGGKMEDVIFAGTASRPPLGRAEVVLSIDNTDGALPIDYAEVTISRTMFRHGGSEYAINGATARLLDVQELLSDSGIGQEMHVIVGQGQLDSVLNATPEDRRGFIEEAAGVLKHRKRKEKALRKLESTDGNLTRLSDLLGEIRRQLKPLGRQAEVARRAAGVQADVRDARARLLADDLVAARVALSRELADESALQDQRTAVETALLSDRALEGRLEDQLVTDAPRLVSAQETWYQLSALRERISGTASLAAERLRAEADPEEAVRSGRDPEELAARAAAVRAEEQAILVEVSARRCDLEAAVVRRGRAEGSAAEEERRAAGRLRAAADHREALARLTGEVETLRGRVRSADEELGRLRAARDDTIRRAERARHDFTSLETRVAGLDAGERGLDAEYEGATSTLADLDERLAKGQQEAASLERERAALAARVEALEMGLNRRDGSGALLAASGQLSGLLGSVAALLSVRTGYEVAVAAALGEAADAVAVSGLEAAVGAIEHLRGDELGRAGLLLAGRAADQTPWPPLPPGAVYAVDLVDAPTQLEPALRRLLHQVAVVEDLGAAAALVRTHPGLVAVSRTGDLLGAAYACGGSARGPSLIEVQAALEDTRERLVATAHEGERLRFELSRLAEERGEAARWVDVALAKLHESDATLAAVAEELGQLGSLVRSTGGEAERLTRAIAEATDARVAHVQSLAEHESRLATTAGVPDDEPTTDLQEQLAEAARAARAAETEARLALRTVEERGRALAGRADLLTRAADSERAATTRAAARAVQRRREATVARSVVAATAVVLARLDSSIATAADLRREVDSSRVEAETGLRAVRSRLRDLTTELDRLTDSVHRDELARTEQRLRIEALELRAVEELGLEPETLVTDYGPDAPVPTFAADAAVHAVPARAAAVDAAVDASPVIADEGEPPGRSRSPGIPYVREEQASRLRAAERALALLGRVNPLALEEFTALEERHRFLTEQLEDVRRTRKDLLDIVRDVDARIGEVFTAAWTDIEREFRAIFPRLFPGGEGRLVLTEPDDLLGTGIDVEARPPGKKVKRLSLLSGGERSLVAVAFLVALFKARPSPFYILDEVEAALDEINLGRLLEIYEELRGVSQLVVITHQKRTMEVADALYGVSMRGDGVSAVISQRLRDAEPA
ncbi:MAG: chromosome segregation protein SMC [Nocardioidaceae bacterium]